MIISMRLHASQEEINAGRARIEDFSYKVHSIQGEERVVIGVVGIGDVTACLESLEAMPGVEKAVRISAPYKFVSKEFRSERSQVRAAGVEIGGEFRLMARFEVVPETFRHYPLYRVSFRVARNSGLVRRSKFQSAS